MTEYYRTRTSGNPHGTSPRKTKPEWPDVLPHPEHPDGHLIKDPAMQSVLDDAALMLTNLKNRIIGPSDVRVIRIINRLDAVRNDHRDHRP